jgi:hypothetical protein
MWGDGHISRFILHRELCWLLHLQSNKGKRVASEVILACTVEDAREQANQFLDAHPLVQEVELKQLLLNQDIYCTIPFPLPQVAAKHVRISDRAKVLLIQMALNRSLDESEATTQLLKYAEAEGFEASYQGAWSVSLKKKEEKDML